MASNPSGLRPSEYNIVIQLDPQEEKTAGGIIVPVSVKDRDELAMDEGTLIAVSPHAFSYASSWPEGSMPQVGDRVKFSRYSGALHERGAHKFRVIKDKELIAVVEPLALAAVA